LGGQPRDCAGVHASRSLLIPCGKPPPIILSSGSGSVNVYARCDAKDCLAVLDRPQSSTTDGSSPAATVANPCCLSRGAPECRRKPTSMCRGLPEKMFLIKRPPPSVRGRHFPEISYQSRPARR